MKPRFIVGLALNRNQCAEFTMGWMKFYGSFVHYCLQVDVEPVVIAVTGAYVVANQNEVIETVIGMEDWDYLLMVEDDQLVPSNFFERAQHYTVPVVSAMIFKRSWHDPNPLPGWLTEDGELKRLTWEEVEPMLDKPALYPVDCVPFGCTAIRRDVLEKWPARPWLKMYSNRGHDLVFGREAKEQGYQLYVDSGLCAGHLGVCDYNEQFYRDAVRLELARLQRV